MSGFSHKDRLIPVITMMVYWGSDAWDGPRTLQEILEIPPERTAEKLQKRFGLKREDAWSAIQTCMEQLGK